MAQGHRGAVELALAVVATTGDRQDAAGAVIQHHRRPLAQLQAGTAGEPLAQLALHCFLEAAVELGVDQEVAFHGHLTAHQPFQVAPHLIAVKRGAAALGAGLAGLGGELDRAAAGGAAAVGADLAVIHHFVEHAIAGLQGRPGIEAGVVAVGGGQQPHQQGRFWQIQPAGGLAVVMAGGIFKTPARAEIDAI